MRHTEDRSRQAPCGCHYDVATGLTTHLCYEHVYEDIRAKQRRGEGLTTQEVHVLEDVENGPVGDILALYGGRK